MPTTTARTTTHLLIIDPQNDFCDLPGDLFPADLTRPALPVPGAHADMQRLAAFIRKAASALSEITLTLDSHHRLDIAHPTFWQHADGAGVTPFTQITAAQVRAGEYQPRPNGVLPRVLAYLDALDAAGRHTLIVWPVHCEIGSWGHNIHADVRQACNAWEDHHLKQATKINKGSNPWTEHYSAMMAEVPDPQDPGTQLNQSLLAALTPADVILIAGEASSHCVKATTEHLLDYLPPRPAGGPGRALREVVLLTDCMSPVAGFEAAQADFFAAMQARSVRLASSLDVLST